jgi:hypothetical protein
MPNPAPAPAARRARRPQEVDGFTSVEDLGPVLDPPADVVEDMRDRAIFIPRPG